MKAMLEGAFWVALGMSVGAAACRPDLIDEGVCWPMTSEGIPLGSWTPTGHQIAAGGVLEITDSEVHLSFEHEEWGPVDVVYARVGEPVCVGCD